MKQGLLLSVLATFLFGTTAGAAEKRFASASWPGGGCQGGTATAYYAVAGGSFQSTFRGIDTATGQAFSSAAWQTCPVSIDSFCEWQETVVYHSSVTWSSITVYQPDTYPDEDPYPDIETLTCP